MVRVGASTRGDPAEIVILTVIPAELEAARRVLQIDSSSREKDADGTVYFRGRVRSHLAARDYAIALTCLGGAGNPGAAAATSVAIARYHPRAVLLMGIAAGVRDKVRIGEVVLSDRVVAYEPAALIRSAAGTREQPRPEIDRAPHTMIQDVVSYRAEPSRNAGSCRSRTAGSVSMARPGEASWSMPSEPEARAASDVPSTRRPAWMLFMQPIALHRMHQAWGLGGDLRKLWRDARARHPVVRALIRRYSLFVR